MQQRRRNNEYSQDTTEHLWFQFYLLLRISVTAPVCHSPIAPYGCPVASFVAANIGHEPLFVPSAKHACTAMFKAALSAGVKAASTTASKTNNIKRRQRTNNLGVLPLPTTNVFHRCWFTVLEWVMLLSPL